MNHLTNLYKHKCEQLQEQINNLTKMLNEANAPTPLPQIDSGDQKQDSAMQMTSTQTTQASNIPVCPYEIGSYGWERWVVQPGNYHKDNPHPFGSKKWYNYEAINYPH